MIEADEKDYAAIVGLENNGGSNWKRLVTLIQEGYDEAVGKSIVQVERGLLHQAQGNAQAFGALLEIIKESRDRVTNE